MNREERIKYLDTHKEEVEYQIEKMAETHYNRLHDIELELTMEYHREWCRNWIYKRAEDENYANCAEEVNGVNISKYIDLIRNDRRKENALIIYMQNENIIGAEVSTINSIDRISTSSKEFDNMLITESKKRDCNKVCLVHNHPTDFAAIPSRFDDNSDPLTKEVLAKENIELVDSGIVTIDDYWSRKQKKGSIV